MIAVIFACLVSMALGIGVAVAIQGSGVLGGWAAAAGATVTLLSLGGAFAWFSAKWEDWQDDYLHDSEWDGATPPPVRYAASDEEAVRTPNRTR